MSTLTIDDSLIRFYYNRYNPKPIDSVKAIMRECIGDNPDFSGSIVKHPYENGVLFFIKNDYAFNLCEYTIANIAVAYKKINVLGPYIKKHLDTRAYFTGPLSRSYELLLYGQDLAVEQSIQF